MTQAPMRLGLVGCGAISNAYAQALEGSREAKIVAVADARIESARALAEQLACPAYEDHRKLLDEAGCEAVIVCTPPVTHLEISLDAIQRKLHVLCEKPLFIESAGARKMIQQADAAGVMLSMSSKFRYVEDVIEAKSIVAAGTLGEVIQFENTFASRVDMSSRWNADPACSGGGVLIDNGTHSVDMIRYFLGPIAEIHSVEGRRIQRLPVEDTVQIFVRSQDEVMGSIDLSWSLDKPLPSFIDIYGSHGTLQIGWKESRYRRTGSSDWVVFGKGYRKIDAFRKLIENFCGAVRGTETSLISSEDALASVDVIEAAYQSLKAHSWTSVGSQPAKAARPSLGPSA